MRIKEMPVNLVRVAVEPEVLAHIGKEVNLKSISRWRNARTENIIGVLRAKEKSENAFSVP